MAENTVIDDKMSSTINIKVPQLRFKEFNGEWDSKKLNKIAKIYDGTHQTPKYTDSGVKFVSVENIHDIYNTDKFISEEEFKKFKIKPQIDDILMTRITAGVIGDTYIVDREEDLGYYVSLALIRKESNDDISFLNYYINSSEFKHELHRRIIHVAFPKKINLGDIGDCSVKLPTKDEQEKLSNFLSSIDELISTQEKKVRTLELYNKGLKKDVFTQKIRFTDEKSNEFPKWEVKPLKDNFSKVVDNRGKTPPLSDKGYPLIEIGSVGNYYVNYNNIIKYVDENTYKTWFRQHLNKGDILFSTVGSTAMCSYYDETIKCCVAQNIVGLRFNEKCDSRFMFYLLTEEKNNRYIKSIQMNGVQPSIKVTQFIKLTFPIPSLEEQQKIADFLTSLDDVLQSEKDYLEKLKLIKKGLLQKMFV